MRTRRLVLLMSLAVLAAGIGLLGGRAYAWTKGLLAERLIDAAWQRHLADGRAHRPWAWADLEPIAQIEAPRLGVRRTILSGATGGSLAFGLGHVDGTALPGRPGNCAVAGHRDRWARFLGELREGDEIRLITRAGSRTYRVAALEIVRAEDTAPLSPSPAGDPDRLTLITCYPFGGLLRSPLRFVAVCAP